MIPAIIFITLPKKGDEAGDSRTLGFLSRHAFLKYGAAFCYGVGKE